jgi:hypothetical protein
MLANLPINLLRVSVYRTEKTVQEKKGGEGGHFVTSGGKSINDMRRRYV